VGGIGKLLVAIVFAASGIANFQDDEPPEKPGIPQVGRPATGFYGAAGTGVTIVAEASPTTLPADEWLTFTLTISKLLNPADVEKPSLKDAEGFDLFQIVESVTLDPKWDSAFPKQRVFVYKLRPISTKVTRIPDVAFAFYDPRRVVAPNRPQDKFPKALSNPIEIQVMAVENKSAQRSAISIPAGWETLESSHTHVFMMLMSSSAWLFLAPFATVAWIVAWRWAFPSAYSLRELTRHRAARQALAAFQSDSVNAEAVMARYLHDRFGIDASCIYDRSTLTEQLARAGLDRSRMALTNEFLKLSDQNRFAPAIDRVAIADRGRELIRQLES